MLLSHLGGVRLKWPLSLQVYMPQNTTHCWTVAAVTLPSEYMGSTMLVGDCMSEVAELRSMAAMFAGMINVWVSVDSK